MATNLLDLAGYVQDQGERGRQSRVRDALSGAATRAYNAEGAADRRVAVSDAIAADPNSGFALGQQVAVDEDRQGKQIYNMARGLKAIYAKNPDQAAAYYEQQLVPGLRRLGFQVQGGFDAARILPVVDQVLAQFDPVGAQGNPTGFREADLKARAAGYEPGTPEYQRFFQIAGGVEGRAPTGGFGFRTVEGPDGRKRTVRDNPRTGAVEIYDETTGEFVPQGGTGQLNGTPATASTATAPTQAAPKVEPAGAEPTPVAAAPTAQIRIQGASDAENATILGAVQAMEAANVPREAIDAYVASQQSRYERPAAAAPQAAAPRPAANPALGVSRTPEEQAAATTAATEAAQLEAYRRGTADVAAREAAVTTAKAGAEAAAAQQFGTKDQREAAAAARTKLPQLNAVDRGVTRIADALAALQRNRIAGTGPIDQYLTQNTPEGQELASAVAAIQTPILSLTRVPGVGSQSDLEARLASMQFPNLGADEAVNANTLRDLRAFVSDLRAAVTGVASGSPGGAPTADAGAPVPTATNPRTGEKIEFRNGAWGPAR